VNGADATPELSVATVIVARLLLNCPLAPDIGAANVTFIPCKGWPPASFTVTAKALAKAVFSAADCGVDPGYAVTLAGAPTACVTVSCCPRTVMWAVRDDVVALAVNEKFTTSFPIVPIVSQGWSLDALRGVPEGSTGSSESVPAAPGSAMLAGPTKPRVSFRTAPPTESPI
jgi:hypothetical protein